MMRKKGGRIAEKQFSLPSPQLEGEKSTVTSLREQTTRVKSKVGSVYTERRLEKTAEMEERLELVGLQQQI